MEKSLCLFETLNKLRNSFSHFKSPLQVNFDKAETFFNIYDAALYRLIDKNKQTKRYDCFTHEHIAPLERTKANIKAENVPFKITAKEIDDIYAKIALIVNAIESPEAKPIPTKSPFKNKLPPEAASHNPAFVTVPAPVADLVPVT